MKIAIAPVTISLGARSKAVHAFASEPIVRDFKLAGEVGGRVTHGIWRPCKSAPSVKLAPCGLLIRPASCKCEKSSSSPPDIEGLAAPRVKAPSNVRVGSFATESSGLQRIPMSASLSRVILLRPASWPKHGFGIWLARAAQRLHPNVLAAALANKLARIAWTVLAQERSYEARIMKAAA